MTAITIPSPVPGVIARERHRKGTLPFDFEGKDSVRDAITERLYTCPNGLSLGARRGGRLHLADANTWEIFTLDERGVVYGETVGWIDDATLERAVRRLARWNTPQHCDAGPRPPAHKRKP